MFLTLRRLVVLIGLAIWSFAAASADTGIAKPTAPASSEKPITVGAFAFANETGSELLSLTATTKPAAYSAAVCGDGRHPVRYVRTQVRRKESSYRQVASNFYNAPGDVYELVEGKATPGETCFVTTGAMLTHISVPSKAPEDSACRAPQIATLAKIAERKVVHCWRLAEMTDGARFVAAQFATVGQSALAAVALVRDEVLLFNPLPGNYSGSGRSVWRVDDGGVFNPGAIRLLFSARLPQGYAAAFLWLGAEGESAQLVVAESADQAREVITAYRYMVPQ